MTGLEKMKSQILEDAETSVRELLADANKQADAVLALAKEEAEEECRQISRKLEAEVKAIEERAASSCDLQRRKALLAAKQEMISEVLNAAYESMIHAADEEYFEMLRKMLHKFVLAQDGEICFSEADLKRLPKGFEEEIQAIAKEKGGVLKLSRESRKVCGGFVLIYGGIEENCTFEAMFNSKRDELLDKVHSFLFL